MKNQKKVSKGMVLLLVVALIATLMVGCAPTGGNAPQPTVSAPKPTAAPAGDEPTKLQEGITLRMWTFLDPTKTSGREVALKQIIENFKNEYNIDVVVEPQVWDVMTAKFFAAHNAGNAPDIQWVNMDDMGTAIKQKALEPFENLFMKDWTDEQLKNVQDSFWDYGSVDGLHYQMGFSRNYIGIIYREDLLKEAGYEAPFKNWDEFRQAAKDLTVENDPITGVKIYGFGSGLSLDKSDPWFVVNTILSEQGSLFAEDGKASFAIDPAVKAIQLFSDMMNVDKSIPEGVVTQSVEDIYKDFNSGKFAMINGGSVRMESLQANCVFDPETIQIMPFPSNTEGKPSPSPITGWSVGVWSGGKYKQEAGKFVEFMFSPESDKLWVEIGGQVPMNQATSALLTDFFKNPTKRYLTDTAGYFVNAAWAQPTEFTLTGWRADFCQAIQDVLVNKKDPMQALKDAEKAFNDRNNR
jgi:multiple sugar transport system substrate-binding protein